ncbi:ComF family protein [Pseudoteredinibacter isoporae]|uniref:ComF family protein n=1 Tax=Pseudoteredinibacter isoporae TaxID=570281 RepID=A0A7X0MXL8_9GAMM|nr:phosphoribosyltransferase family protein [Pseudoteredinibacter isoporae]MBB6521087.1 ComF family protein [Pseudoteredinibacter isoporae]NHO86651.1 hypothetical protein [Pseudoteredinibacter isoporae]NIB24897.1 hypothetical protein [Pseudoteredinibacter isoporae]
METQLSRAVGIYLAQCDRAYDAVLAVPSHPLRRFRRGYNPSYQLAKAVSQYCQCPHTQALGKSRWSHSQQGLNRKQRLKNLSGSFSVHGPVAGQRLLLIDDVMTTATTANVISELLLNHGATSVDIACLARTPQHMSS